jgi:Protein of unknown function (DUF5672)
MIGLPASQLSVVVPVYRPFLDANETISLESVFRVLGAHHLVMVKPAGLDTAEIEARFPFKGVETFDPRYFESVQGYNRLLLATGFYERFLGSAYLLICQLDVFVFRDELAGWVARGYDYVGAPWISRSAASLLIHRVTMGLGKLRPGGPVKVYPYETRNRVGNGGFSLRRVETHYRLSLELKDAIDHYLRNQGTHHFHEDVFWSVEPSKRGHPHRTPGVAEALAFSWDINPDRLFRMAGGHLPMAAHGWYKGRHLKFWAPRVAAARASAGRPREGPVSEAAPGRGPA